MRILIYCPEHSGHHLQYLHHLLAPVSELASEIAVAVPSEAVDTFWYDHYLAPRADEVRVDASLPAYERTLISALRQAAHLRRVIRELEPDHVLIPSADGLVDVLAALTVVGVRAVPPGLEVEGLLLRGSFAYRGGGPLGGLRRRLILALRSRAPLSRIHHLDPIPFAMIIDRGGSLARRSGLMPEPVEAPSNLDRESARAELGIPTPGRYIGCAGGMTCRKGIDLLIKAFASAELAPEDRLLLAGRTDDEVRELIDGPCAELVDRERMVVLDRYFSDTEFTTLFRAMDVVCTPYPRHVGSSGVVIRAAAARRPLLATSFGWIGSTVERFSLGRTCRVTDTTAFSEAIAESLAEASELELGEAARRLCAFHTVANFQHAWTARLRERLGMPPSPVAPTWEQVLEALPDPRSRAS
jgi:glycosyltransferase involved in cell wall biosynthesis